MGGITFVNLSHPGDIQNPHVQADIRRHVMKDIGRSRRKRPHSIVIPLQFRTQSLDKQFDGDDFDASCDAVQNPSWSLNPCGILGVDLDERALQIVHFIVNDKYDSLVRAVADYKYRPFCIIWVRMGLSDSTAFYLSLASSLLFWDQMNGLPTNSDYSDNRESAKYYFEALRQLSKRLSDPQDCVSVGVIATVLGCLYHDTNVGNWKRWAVHLNGLERIFKLRGGFDGLENHLSLIAFWLELVGRAVIDSPPQFQIPGELQMPDIQEAPPALQRVLFGLESKYPQLSPVFRALWMMVSITETVNRSCSSTYFWEDELGAISLLAPVTHHLLSAPRLFDVITENPDILVVGELVRLTCLMLLSCLKKRFLLNSSDMVPLQAKFAGLVAQNICEPDRQLQGLRLWALVTSALLYSRDKRVDLIPPIRGLMKNQGLSDSRAVINSVRELIWINVLEDHEEVKLAQEVDDDIISSI